MGYTHYWNTAAAINEYGTFEVLATRARAIAKLSGVPIAYEHDQPARPAVFGAGMIRFNGIGNDGHETFLLEPEPIDSDFCKTAAKPYDDIVTAILATAAHLGLITVSSDGDCSNWQQGLLLASAVAGEVIPCPLGGD